MVSDIEIWRYVASISGHLLLPLIVSVAELFMSLNMSVVLMDKFSESLRETKLLLLLSDPIKNKFFYGY